MVDERTTLALAAAGHAAAGQDVNTSASEAGVAAGRPHGEVVPRGPTQPRQVGG